MCRICVNTLYEFAHKVKKRCQMWKEESQTEIMWKKKEEAYNTCFSQAVTHPSTEQARHCLTSVNRRELVYSVWYGRRQ